MIPLAAQYLLRFDDLCPTHHRERWQRFPPLFPEFGIRPILAIVPENCDPALQLAPPDSDFWQEMRMLQASGATIGLHGYRHLCTSRSRSLVPLHRQSEFAGVAESTQREWIHAGLEILRTHNHNPKIWVAPRHGFDRATRRALQSEGVALLSDGFALRPFRRDGITCLPQQLWEPVAKESGLWTICIHANTAPNAQCQQLRDFISCHQAQFTSVDRALARFGSDPLTWREQLDQAASIMRIRIRQSMKKILGSQSARLASRH